MLVSTIVLVVYCVAALFVSRGTLHCVLPWVDKTDAVIEIHEKGGSVSVSETERNDIWLEIDLKAHKQGKVTVDVLDADNSQSVTAPYNYNSMDIHVLAFDIIFVEDTWDFSGGELIFTGVWIYVVILTVLFCVSFILRCKNDLYNYTTLFYGGISLLLAALLAISTIEMLYSPAYSAKLILHCFAISTSIAMLLAIPFTLLFSLFLIISNIILIRREGAGLANVLAIGVGSVLILGLIGNFFVGSIFISGSLQEVRRIETVTSVFQTLFTYFENMLIGTVICGIIAAKRKPETDYDHVMILGCQVGGDGTALPLLEGRIKCALEYAKKRKADTGKDTVFVCSGGQGSDEPISEALCMKNYLLENGISEQNIILEDKSTSTGENLRFSMEKIGGKSEKILFSTSDYHVLRSGIIGKGEGFRLVGIGAKTRAYFWANAFMREFIGLAVAMRRRNLFNICVLTVTIAAFTFFSYL